MKMMQRIIDALWQWSTVEEAAALSKWRNTAKSRFRRTYLRQASVRVRVRRTYLRQTSVRVRVRRTYLRQASVRVRVKRTYLRQERPNP